MRCEKSWIFLLVLFRTFVLTAHCPTLKSEGSFITITPTFRKCFSPGNTLNPVFLVTINHYLVHLAQSLLKHASFRQLNFLSTKKWMNYIKHLSAIFETIDSDSRLTPYHISLYISLFRRWNLNYFKNPISISRDEIMKMAKIGSVNTYTKCIKELHLWSYIRYEPSYNPHKGSLIYLYTFDNATDSGGEIALRPIINNTNIINKEITTAQNHFSFFQTA